MNNKVITYLLGALVVGFAAATYHQNVVNDRLETTVDSLRYKIKQYEKRDGTPFVVERISKQMEDIAYQQMDISDKRREEALYQMNVADEMRSRAESERRKAQEFAQSAVEARNMAEQQRELAVDLQLKAEHSRNVADTLSYIALGRSLASLSSMQYLADNKDAASLLAYAAWKFVTDYKGNVDIPVILKALTQNSGSYTSSLVHKGGVSRIVPFGKSGNFVSVSRYGGIALWSYADGKWKTSMLSSNPDYSFRDVCVDNENVIYALDFGGRLLTIADGHVAAPIALPESAGWSQLFCIDGRTLLLASDHNLHFFDTTSRTITKSVAVPQSISAVGEREGRFVVFGKKGGAWSIGSDGNLTSEEILVKGVVTAYEWSPENNIAAIGTEAGDIFIVDDSGYSRGKLVGHMSRITDIICRGNKVYSASYDHAVMLWDVRAVNREPVSLNEYSSWVYCLSMPDDNSLFVGDETGTVSRIVVSPNEMAMKIHESLKRDFTPEEWSYYIGDNVPRISLKNN